MICILEKTTRASRRDSGRGEGGGGGEGGSSSLTQTCNDVAVMS